MSSTSAYETPQKRRRIDAGHNDEHACHACEVKTAATVGSAHRDGVCGNAVLQATPKTAGDDDKTKVNTSLLFEQAGIKCSNQENDEQCDCIPPCRDSDYEAAEAEEAACKRPRLDEAFWLQLRRWILDAQTAAVCRRVCRAWNIWFAQPVHPRDRRLRFDEPTHSYFIDGKRGRVLSVTTWLHSFFEFFCAAKAIRSMRNGRKWNASNPLFGKTDDEIKQIWEENRNSAAAQGTKMHAHLETLFKARIAKTPFDEMGVAEELLRHSHLRSFLESHDHLRAYRLEWSLFDEELQLAGTVDALFIDKRSAPASASATLPALLRRDVDDFAQKHAALPSGSDSADLTLTLVDWKRSRRIAYENPWQHGLPGTPVEHLDDCNVQKYTLQLNVYKALLKKQYRVHIAEMFLIVFHPDQDDFVKVPIEDQSQLIEELFEVRKRQLADRTVTSAAHHQH